MRRALVGVAASWIAMGVAAGCANLGGLSGGGAGDAGDAASGQDAKPHIQGDTGASKVDAKHDATREATTPEAGHDAAGEAGTGCVIAGKTYASGAVDPTNACAGCEPSVATSAWSNLSDGTACGSGGVCYLGGCVSGCEIGGVYYATNAPDPNDPCRSCQPGQSTKAWEAIADGSDCGNGQVCASGECGTQCDIAGSITSSGAADPANGCETCQPGTSTSTWTGVSDGTGCAAGEVCSATTCGAGCFITGALYTPQTANPNNACQSCQPGTTTTAWSNVTDGTACGNGQICGDGECGTQCAIAGIVYPSGVLDPANACASCQPGTSTSAWTNAANGTSCGAGKVCNAALCTPGCFIASKVEAAAFVDPANACLSCQPGTSTTAWSDVTNGTTCGTGEACMSGLCTGSGSGTGVGSGSGAGVP